MDTSLYPTAGASGAPGTAEPGLFLHGEPTDTWAVSCVRAVRYEVRLVPGLLTPGNPALATAGGPATDRPRRLVVVEEQVWKLYGDRLAAYFDAHTVAWEPLVLPAHEEVKTMESVFRVAEGMDRFGIARRHEPVIAVGGGVLMDIVGLAASLYRRSTPYVRVPTTLVGMIDAGIGAKTGVNSRGHKNRLGAYHPSAATLIDPRFLATLDRRHIANGLAEILKLALVKSPELFELLSEHGPRLAAERLQATDSSDGGAVARDMLRQAVHGMLTELQPNLWEHELERLVDYGHTFSPAIEIAALPALLHGEAVCVDMALTTVIARARGLLSAHEERRVLTVMRGLRLPLWHPVCTEELLRDALEDTVRHRDGLQRVPLPDGIGGARFVNDLTQAELAAGVRRLAELGAERGQAA